MKKLINKISSVGLGLVGIAIILILIYALSWIITCGIVKLIAMCFGWTFSWAIATGVWVAALFIKWIFKQKG